MRVAIVGYGYMGQMYADSVKEQNWQLIGGTPFILNAIYII